MSQEAGGDGHEAAADPEPAGEGPAHHRAAWLRRGIYVVFALGVVAYLVEGAFFVGGADGPADPVLAPAQGTASTGPAAGGAPGTCAGSEGDERWPLDGFGEVAFRVAGPDGGEAFVGCALLADTPETRGQGLMDQQDLRGYDAMVFRFDAPSTGAFYMFQTILPLSIAYVAADGGLVSSTDMDPCPEEEASACPTFPATGPYLHAIEVGQGGLPSVGLVPGATVSFGDRP